MLIFYFLKPLAEQSPSANLVEWAEIAELEPHKEVFGHGHKFGQGFWYTFNESAYGFLDFSRIVHHAVAHVLYQLETLARCGQVVLIKHMLIYKQLNAFLEFTYLISEVGMTIAIIPIWIDVGLFIFFRLFDCRGD